ncbi:Aspartic peptidase [Gossypium australe]|uniref:Aspartic peptidase n=1 Tax=Gossypium australe TaxID=47621 RepID=A0A5B6UYC4_9ROSI|nr:Aspartic peptidase [Gossypium australe]
MEDILEEYMAKNEAIIQSQATSLEVYRIKWGVVNDATIEERSLDFTNKKNSKLVVEQAMKENSNQKSVEVDSLVFPIKIPWQNNLNRWKEGHRHLFLSVYKNISKKFLDVMKQLHINIPLVEAVEQMPNYVIFMKNIISKKIRLGEFETVALTEGCIAILRNKLPTKLKGPRSFTIPCSFGNHYACAVDSRQLV